MFHGDCLRYLEQIPDCSVDALITDPPYSSGGLHVGARQQAPSEKYLQSGGSVLYPEFMGDQRDQRSHLRWYVLWLTEAFRALKTGAPVCLFSDWRQLPLTTDALQAADFTWRGIAVWDKTEGVRPQKGRFSAQAEYIVWGSKGAMPLGRSVPPLPGVVREPVRRKDKFHITGKPTALMRALVKICEPGGVILDPFAGSGSTLVAAALEGYRWLASEALQHNVQIAQERLKTVGAAGTVVLA
ncbi:MULTISPECIES: DNA-methyltransferase [unclassified Pseudomonas]|uniref:DNA-methyltransferase n=1 Tax=unclassified Pseudomonas TaxID=196821 RepID=UPI0008EF30A7|nr:MULTISPECIES: site-specific DNA-methyltransferase [unclassified Pseudomonas]PMV27265.1 site-specific DNA-methyltransferase [Pseudomonas sp. FW305-3-2-15-C-TSA2]PMV32520.1 site-specific DNA-methyltransferase [Pseudomonas sp. DP16D-L5]PMV42234.1 site-specific DNA-methyltransferase [Pseudomonas sp. FW305-3-2-15-A-LB2]PMV49726.1 site-specific DNA-methyltransferase [Pseudomonas sp. FW305-3-2-15-C-R2A1]PMV55158.1 site-specific DNA-methyltransferase [Pseudomonas sp. FW305-3-2-15-C-LB1]